MYINNDAAESCGLYPISDSFLEPLSKSLELHGPNKVTSDGENDNDHQGCKDDDGDDSGDNDCANCNENNRNNNNNNGNHDNDYSNNGNIGDDDIGKIIMIVRMMTRKKDRRNAERITRDAISFLAWKGVWRKVQRTIL